MFARSLDSPGSLGAEYVHGWSRWLNGQVSPKLGLCRERLVFANLECPDVLAALLVQRNMIPSLSWVADSGIPGKERVCLLLGPL